MRAEFHLRHILFTSLEGLTGSVVDSGDCRVAKCDYLFLLCVMTNLAKGAESGTLQRWTHRRNKETDMQTVSHRERGEERGGGKRERETETERQRQRDRDRETERETQTERHRH